VGGKRVPLVNVAGEDWQARKTVNRQEPLFPCSPSGGNLETEIIEQGPQKERSAKVHR
jgi:hypothetical protein